MKTTAETFRKLAESIVGELAGKDGEFNVIASQCKMSGEIVVEAIVGPDHIGKLIGKGGKMFKAISRIMDRAARLVDAEVRFAVPDQPGHSKSKPSPFEANRKWTSKKMEQSIKVVCGAIFANEVDIEVLPTSSSCIIEIGLDDSEMIGGAEMKQVEEDIRMIFTAAGKSQGRIVDIKLIK